MKTNINLFSVFIACTIAWFDMASAADNQVEAMNYVRGVMASVDKIDTDDLKTKIDANQDFVLLDLRTPDEIRKKKKIDAPQQLEIPRGSLETQIFQHVVDKDAPIVAYCGAGFRSALAVKTLKQMGFTNVVNYEEGFFLWERSGNPVIKDNRAE